MPDANLEELKAKRKQIKTSITRHEKAITSFTGTDASAISARIPSLTSLFVDYNKIQEQIEKIQLDGAEDDEAKNKLEEEHNEDRSKIEGQYFSALGVAEKLSKVASHDSIQRETSSTVINISKTTNSEYGGNSILTPLPLPTFTGNYNEWYSFIDTFNVYVHQDPSIPIIRKFHYLRSCLKNEALQAIIALPISSENYDVALNLLKTQFENKRIIVQDHIDEILNTPQLERPTSVDIRNLINTIRSNLAALTKLEIPTHSWDALLIQIIAAKLDYISRREWQTSLSKNIPTIDELLQFLERRHATVATLSKLKSHTPKEKSSTSSMQSKANSSFQKSHTRTSNYAGKLQCAICKETHAVFMCDTFLKMDVAERVDRVKELKLCCNCFRGNHATENCRSKFACKTCNNRHHTLLHVDESQNQPSDTAKKSMHITANRQVLLSTVKIMVASKTGSYHYCRALLDQGSEINLITSKLVRALRLPLSSTTTTITGVNSNETHGSSCARISIKSITNDYAFTSHCYVLNTISQATPSAPMNVSSFKYPSELKLADPDFFEAKQVDILLGAPVFWKILIGAPMQFDPKQPYMQETRMGWIFGGEFDTSIQENSRRSCHFIQCCPNSILDKQLSKMWEDDTIETSKRIPTSEQRMCEKHYTQTTIRLESGQFAVRLPFKVNWQLGNSRALARSQFFGLEQRLLQNPTLKKSYVEFMNEYLSMGHMEEVPEREINKINCFYMPHHPVFKQTVKGPKLRVVFNASAKSDNKQSLNDVLLLGPVLQDDLFNILLRFRIHKFVMTADITKMYRMIQIQSCDRDFQRILWRSDPSKPLQEYRLTTVTYGTKSAPYQAVRTLHDIAEREAVKHPRASEILRTDFYMDDLVTGSDSLEDMLQIKNDLIKMLADGNFDLCKWTSNCTALTEYQDIDAVNLTTGDEAKVLGFYWNHRSDQLHYNVVDQPYENMTKRRILADVAKIFDPLGLINPIVVSVKILLQELWTKKLGWDQRLPDDIQEAWRKIVSEFKHLQNLKICRRAVYTIESNNVELHCFTDASTKAYGCAVYIKSIDTNGQTEVHLLCAKSRVAPLKIITLPRLELNAALLGTKLLCKVKSAFHPEIKSCMWTDSTIVIAWINAEPTKWNCYVANRVAKIQELATRTKWMHVRSHDNPADIVSRGMNAYNVVTSQLWWNGPQWLSHDSTHWPDQVQAQPEESQVEAKRTKQVYIAQQEPELPVITKFSSFEKLIRVVVYCNRFKHNCKNANKIAGPLQAEEIDKSRLKIIKYIQHRELREIIEAVKKGKTHKLIRLDPFLDSDEILRVGGRLRFASISVDKKHPIILPEKHYLTKLIIRDVHVKMLHSGNETTLAAVRDSFWPIGGRKTVRSIIHHCITCFKARPVGSQQKMGDLPEKRITLARPFLACGVDYAGPFLIKSMRSRSKTELKAYAAVFICFATKAIHIELVGDLTTQSFLAAFKRFISRRGHVADIFCDNGRNFVGAERILTQSSQYKDKIIDFCASRNIRFHFIPARSPHFGGLWERAIRSVKHHLLRVMKNAYLTYEELYTLLTSIEACLNSRPLTRLSENPDDYEPLTPAHFLIGDKLTSPIDVDLQDVPENRLTRWQRVKQLQQHFWKRWQNEYLTQLQQRPKGQQQACKNLEVGDLVILMEENTPPLSWRLGRVTKTHPGEDGLVRAATVATQSGETKRAAKKLCRLPKEEE